jgi:hypothetical protein
LGPSAHTNCMERRLHWLLSLPEALSYATVLDYGSSGDSHAYVLFDNDTLILKGHITDRIAQVVDRNAPELWHSRLYRSVTGDHSRDDIIDYLTVFSYCYDQMIRWETAQPKRQDRKVHHRRTVSRCLPCYVGSCSAPIRVAMVRVLKGT